MSRVHKDMSVVIGLLCWLILAVAVKADETRIFVNPVTRCAPITIGGRTYGLYPSFSYNTFSLFVEHESLSFDGKESTDMVLLDTQILEVPVLTDQPNVFTFPCDGALPLGNRSVIWLTWTTLIFESSLIRLSNDDFSDPGFGSSWKVGDTVFSLRVDLSDEENGIVLPRVPVLEQTAFAIVEPFHDHIVPGRFSDLVVYTAHEDDSIFLGRKSLHFVQVVLTDRGEHVQVGMLKGSIYFEWLRNLNTPVSFSLWLVVIVWIGARMDLAHSIYSYVNIVKGIKQPSVRLMFWYFLCVALTCSILIVCTNVFGVGWSGHICRMLDVCWADGSVAASLLTYPILAFLLTIIYSLMAPAHTSMSSLVLYQLESLLFFNLLITSVPLTRGVLEHFLYLLSAMLWVFITSYELIKVLISNPFQVITLALLLNWIWVVTLVTAVCTTPIFAYYLYPFASVPVWVVSVTIMFTLIIPTVLILHTAFIDKRL